MHIFVLAHEGYFLVDSFKLFLRSGQICILSMTIHCGIYPHVYTIRCILIVYTYPQCCQWINQLLC